MLSKYSVAPLFLLALASFVDAHAAITPALGVKGTPTRDDVQRPSKVDPCGNVNIAQNLDNSTPVPANANGSFSPSVLDFNPGADGSRSIQSVLVDSSGTGKNFTSATMVVNGDPNPQSDATQQLTVQLPADTKCEGGSNKNLCLVSFTTTAGFGNCVVVSQGTGTAKPSPSPSEPSSPRRTGAAKGVKRANPSGDQDPPQSSEPADKKGTNKGHHHDKPKGGAKAKPGADPNRVTTPDNQHPSKSGDQTKGTGKEHHNKHKTKPSTGAKHGAKSTHPATPRMFPKRQWSSRNLH